VELQFGEWIDALRAGLGLVPPALLAIVLLGGPTAFWLLYHFVVEPRVARMRVLEMAPFWVCANCRSVNDARFARCYRCDAEPAEDELEIIEPEPSGPSRLAPVGPGLSFGASGVPTRPGPGSIPILQPQPSSLESVPRWDTGSDDWDEELEEDRVALPDVAAMTEVIEVPRMRRSVRKPGPIPVGPGRPAVARPRRVAAAGQSGDPGDDPSAA
jgi:hypothetical protein